MILSLVLAAASLAPVELLREAEAEYRAGLEAAADAERARARFRRAAELYEQLWRGHGVDTATLHRQRAQSYLLAGDLANALRAYHEGRRGHPADAGLQRGQRYARSRVLYPADGVLRGAAAQRSPWRLSDHLAPKAVSWIAAGLYAAGWFAAVLARGRRRPGWWAVAVVAWLAAAAGVSVSLWEQGRERGADPWAVVAVDGVTLREGNARSFPARLAEPLPLGVEVRVRHRRGGWARVALADGTAGWLPGPALIVERGRDDTMGGKR